jgi:hypothetical protein
MRIGSVTATAFLAICCLVSVSCDIGGAGEVEIPPQGEPSLIRGRLWFHPSKTMFYRALGDPCEVDGQSYDLRAGTPVVVKDVAGSTIATGELEPGVIVELSLGVPHGCRFDFTVRDVPVSAYYTIQVSPPDGTSLSLSYDELEAAGWAAEWGIGW